MVQNAVRDIRTSLAERFPLRRRLVTSFINNDFLEPAGSLALPVIDPATEETVAEVEEADAGVVGSAVNAARQAFETGPWPRLSVEQRQTILRRIADLIDAHTEELAFLECLNSGIPMRHLALGQIPRAAYNFRFFADYVGQSKGDVYSQQSRYLTLVTERLSVLRGLLDPGTRRWR